MSFEHVKSVTIGDFTGTVSVFNSAGATQTIAATDLVRPSDWNSAHNERRTFTGNTVLNSTVSGTNLILYGLGNVSVGGSSGSIGISGGPNKFSTYANLFYKMAATTNSAFYTAPQFFGVAPFMVHDHVEADHVRYQVTVAHASTQFASTANTTFSYRQQITFSGIIYQRGTGSNSSRLESKSSYSNSIAQTVNAVYGSASNTSQGWSYGLTYPDSTGGTGTFSTQFSTQNSASWNFSTANLSRLSGNKLLDMTAGITLDPGEYVLMFRHSTAQTSQGVNLSGIRMQITNAGISQFNAAFAPFGQLSSASVQGQVGIGSFSTAGSVSTDPVPLSALSAQSIHFIPIFSFSRSTM